MIDLNRIFCLELKTVEKIRCPQKRIFKAARDENYLMFEPDIKQSHDFYKQKDFLTWKGLRWLGIVSNTHILTGRYNHSIT